MRNFYLVLFEFLIIHLADKNIVTIRVIKFVVLVVIAIILTIGGNDMSLTLIISKILEDSLARIFVVLNSMLL